MEADFDFIHIDMDNLLAVGANLRDLAIKIDRISTARATGNNNANDSCFLFHFSAILSKTAEN